MERALLRLTLSSRQWFRKAWFQAMPFFSLNKTHKSWHCTKKNRRRRRDMKPAHTHPANDVPIAYASFVLIVIHFQVTVIWTQFTGLRWHLRFHLICDWAHLCAEYLCICCDIYAWIKWIYRCEKCITHSHTPNALHQSVFSVQLRADAWKDFIDIQ